MLRDANIFEVQETEDSIAIAFEDKSAEASSRIKLFLATKPNLQMRAWITKDVQGFDTRIDLTDITKIEGLDPALFDPTARFERTR